jgi:mannosylglycoprotein endo-beta-mannosidase
LEKVSRAPLTYENIAKQRIIAKEIEDMLKREEIHWAQRSRINCLQHGDKNTSYFHHFANETKKINMIRKLKDDSGARVEGVADLNPMVSDYFAGLFSSEIEEPGPELINKVNPKVDDRINEQLLKPFTAKDVKKALFSIGDMKAPGQMVFMLFSSRNVGTFWGRS